MENFKHAPKAETSCAPIGSDQVWPYPFPPLRINYITSKDWAAFLKYSAKNLTCADNCRKKQNQKTETKERKVIGGRGWTGEEREEKEQYHLTP